MERGAEIEAKDVNNQTPLHLAALSNSIETAKLLLESGAEIEARDVNNRTPLDVAARKNSAETAILLLERGEEIEARNVNNQTALRNDYEFWRLYQERTAWDNDFYSNY